MRQMTQASNFFHFISLSMHWMQFYQNDNPTIKKISSPTTLYVMLHNHVTTCFSHVKELQNISTAVGECGSEVILKPWFLAK